MGNRLNSNAYKSRMYFVVYTMEDELVFVGGLNETCQFLKLNHRHSLDHLVKNTQRNRTKYYKVYKCRDEKEKG